MDVLQAITCIVFLIAGRQMLKWADGVQAITCIVSLIAGGRVLLRPMYRFISKLGNEDIFQATTILVVLGTSMMTQLAGLSLALGAFLVGACKLSQHSCPLRVISTFGDPMNLWAWDGFSSSYVEASEGTGKNPNFMEENVISLDVLPQSQLAVRDATLPRRDNCPTKLVSTALSSLRGGTAEIWCLMLGKLVNHPLQANSCGDTCRELQPACSPACPQSISTLRSLQCLRAKAFLV